MPDRREYTIIGDAVNVPARREEANQVLGSSLIGPADALTRGGRETAARGLTGEPIRPLRGCQDEIAVAYRPAEAPVR